MTAMKKIKRNKYHTVERWPQPVGRRIAATFQGADSPEQVEQVRAAIAERTATLRAERKKIDAKLGVKAGAKISAKKRAAIHAHMEPFGFTAERVRAAL